MGDMREYFDIYRKVKKDKKAKNTDKYEPLLRAIGAEQRGLGIWMYGSWMMYPSNGFAMNKYTHKKRHLETIIREITYVKNRDNK